MLMLPLSWLHELRELLRQDRITSPQVTLSLCANQNARLPKALGEFLQVYTTSRRSSAINHAVITADIGRAGWPALVQIRAINVPVGFYCSRNVRVVLLSYHVGNSASMSPVEFSKRPMSAVANYPFHTPIDICVCVCVCVCVCRCRCALPPSPQWCCSLRFILNTDGSVICFSVILIYGIPLLAFDQSRGKELF